MTSWKTAVTVVLILATVLGCRKSPTPVEDERLEGIRKATVAVGWDWREEHEDDRCGLSRTYYVAFHKSKVAFIHQPWKCGGRSYNCFNFEGGPVSLLHSFTDWQILRGNYVFVGSGELAREHAQFIVRIQEKRKTWEGAGQTLEEAIIQAILRREEGT